MLKPMSAHWRTSLVYQVTVHIKQGEKERREEREDLFSSFLVMDASQIVTCIKPNIGL